MNAQVIRLALDAPVDIMQVSTPWCLERVKDKYYGDGLHDFIYCAAMGPGNKKWLTLNLGAEYARVGSPDFNPEIMVRSADDTKAFGSQFLWGRPANGHELVDSYEVASDGLYYKINRKLVNASNHKEWWDKDKKVIDYNLNDVWGNNDADPCPNGYKVASIGDLYRFIYSSRVDTDRSFRQTQIVNYGAILSLVFAPQGKFYEGSYTWQNNKNNIPNKNGNTDLPGTAILWGLHDGYTYWFSEIGGVDWGNWKNGNLIYWYNVVGDGALYIDYTGAIRCVEK